MAVRRDNVISITLRQGHEERNRNKSTLLEGVREKCEKIYGLQITNNYLTLMEKKPKSNQKHHELP